MGDKVRDANASGAVRGASGSAMTPAAELYLSPSRARYVVVRWWRRVGRARLGWLVYRELKGRAERVLLARVGEHGWATCYRESGLGELIARGWLEEGAGVGKPENVLACVRACVRADRMRAGRLARGLAGEPLGACETRAQQALREYERKRAAWEGQP